jgi:hypothetical protein
MAGEIQRYAPCVVAHENITFCGMGHSAETTHAAPADIFADFPGEVPGIAVTAAWGFG